MKTLTVTSLQNIGLTTVEVKFKPQFDASYLAGQYIVVVAPISKDVYYFSMASAPSDYGEITIHIGDVRSTTKAKQLVAEMKVAGFAFCEGIGGNAYLRDTHRPMILIAGGSGYSYARSLLLQELSTERSRTITLIWGGEDVDALYEMDELQSIEKGAQRLNFIPVLSRGDKPVNGFIGNLLKVSYDLALDFSAADIYVCGRPEMVRSCKQHMLKYLAVDVEHFYSDVE
ncbi:hypothetical protein [Vibrio rotiferianus]|uniref:hypothetical protein n=1 Tax=Vibrio rotiferianus TaxID=190895 RepID=UPI000B5A0DFA|nr:hypothetical protein [Vibrio rotiferianus]ASI96133.1 hypothetical protein BSZ04_14205 [Vibrio rotiferianus]